MYKLRYSVLCLFLPLLLLAQDNLPVTQSVQVEVLTSELQKNSRAQNLHIKISCTTAQPGQKFLLDLNEINAVLVPIKASRDEDALWLVKANEANDNDIVLAWNANAEDQLQLAPGAWTTPYEIDLQIQISFSNLIDVPNITETQLDVIVVDGSLESLASPTGRGNQISLNNTRE